MSQLMYHGQEDSRGRVHVKYTTMQRLIMTLLPDHLTQNCTFTLLLMWFLTALVARQPKHPLWLYLFQRYLESDMQLKRKW